MHIGRVTASLSAAQYYHNAWCVVWRGSTQTVLTHAGRARVARATVSTLHHDRAAVPGATGYVKWPTGHPSRAWHDWLW
jgi:hypothetical protein